VLQSLGELNDAAARYERALELKPAFGHARVNLAATRIAQGRVYEAEAQYREAIRLEPDLATARVNLGMILQRQGRLDEAAQSFEEALRLEGESTESLRSLAVILSTHPDRRRRQPDRALEYAERAVALTGRSDPRMLEALAEVHAAAGRTARARAALDEAVALAEARSDPMLPGLRQKRDALGAGRTPGE